MWVIGAGCRGAGLGGGHIRGIRSKMGWRRSGQITMRTYLAWLSPSWMLWFLLGCKRGLCGWVETA